MTRQEKRQKAVSKAVDKVIEVSEDLIGVAEDLENSYCMIKADQLREIVRQLKDWQYHISQQYL